MGPRSHRWKGLVLLAFLSVPGALAAQDVRTRVEINTTLGRMVVALYNETPKHRDNFLQLVRTHYYDSTLFHRAVPGFMVQGGDPNSRLAADHHTVMGRGGPGHTVPQEVDRRFIHKKGALAAAQPTEGSNDEHRSHGSQFFLVEGERWSPGDLQLLVQRKNEKEPGIDHGYTPDQVKTYATSGGVPRLDGTYTVFGEVVEGLDVLDRIAAVPCDPQDRPLTDVRIWMRVLP